MGGTVRSGRAVLSCRACLVPGAPPMNVTAVAVSPTAVRVSWQPPPAERANGRIAYYKLLCVESGRGDSEAMVVKLNQTSFVLDELRRWTEYRIWVLAGTSVGDGPASYPVTVRTHEDGTCHCHIHITNLSTVPCRLNFMTSFARLKAKQCSMKKKNLKN